MKEISFTPFPNLQTQHFDLRMPSLSDSNDIFIMRSDENNAKYLDRPLCKSTDEAVQFIQRVLNGIENNDSFYWMITSGKDAKVFGTICLWNIDRSEAKAEIGFELLPAFQGKGIMQEVIPAVIEFGFNNTGLKYIEGEVDPDNIKSIKLMGKFGFKFDKKLDVTVVYTLVNPNYRK